MNKLTFKQFKSKLRKSIPNISKNTALIIAGVVIGIIGVGIANPGHIVQKSLSLVGIDSETEQSTLSEKSAQTDEVKTNDSENTNTSNGDDSVKTDKTNSNGSSEQSTPEPTGSHTVITPEELQTHKDNGDPYLIQGTDWKVKINSQLPSSCGTSANHCPAGTTATVNVSPYNVHTGELLPMTECNGTAADIHSPSDSTPTALPDAYHCVLTFNPSKTGQYWFQIELYLSKSVYTDTIYWGGWVWGGTSDSGYFVN